jgi:tryptophanyl-tRNA synthetase
MADRYRRGGFGYGEVKKALAEAAADYFADARRRREELESDPGRIEAILAEGAARARVKAADVLARARRACGLSRGPAGRRA